MAKKYYWLKLKNNFFNQPRIKKLRKIAGGDTYTIIYLKLQLLSLENEGYLIYEGIEPTVQEELSLIIDEEVDNVEVALQFLFSQGLIEEAEKDLYKLTETIENIGSETASANRVRRHREKKKAQKTLQCNADVISSNTEIEIEKDKDKEIELELELYTDDKDRLKAKELTSIINQSINDNELKKLKTSLERVGKTYDDLKTKLKESDYLKERSKWEWIAEEENLRKIFVDKYKTIVKVESKKTKKQSFKGRSDEEIKNALKKRGYGGITCEN